MLINFPAIFYRIRSSNDRQITSDELQKVLAQAAEDTYSSTYNSRLNTLLKAIKCVIGHEMGSI